MRDARFYPCFVLVDEWLSVRMSLLGVLMKMAVYVRVHYVQFRGSLLVANSELEAETRKMQSSR